MVYSFPMIRIALPLVLFATAVSAQDEEFLPSRFPLDRYSAGWENSPFNREVAKVVVASNSLAFGRGIVLEGVVSDDQTGTIAYARDLVQGILMIITEKSSEEHPFTIKSTSQANDPRETSVTITDGKEQAEIRFESELLTRAITNPSSPSVPPILEGKAPPSEPMGTPSEPTGTPLKSTDTVVPEAGDNSSGRRRILSPDR